MSSYLNIGVKIRTSEKSTIDVELFSFNRGDTTYKTLDEELGYTNEKRTLDIERVKEAYNSLKSEISDDDRRKGILHTRCITVANAIGEDTISEYLEWKKYVDEKKNALHNISFIIMLLEEAELEDKIVEYYYWIG